MDSQEQFASGSHHSPLAPNQQIPIQNQQIPMFNQHNQHIPVQNKKLPGPNKKDLLKVTTNTYPFKNNSCSPH